MVSSRHALAPGESQSTLCSPIDALDSSSLAGMQPPGPRLPCMHGIRLGEPSHSNTQPPTELGAAD